MKLFPKPGRDAVMRAAIVFGTLALGGLLVLHSKETPPERVGPLPNGGFLLNSGWTIRPAGQQVSVDTFPMSAAVSNNGKYLLVLNGGYNPPSISVVDIAQKKEIGRTPVPDGWLGLWLTPKGDRLYVGGGSRATVYEFSFDAPTGVLARAREFTVAVDTATKGAPFIGDVVTSSDAHLLYAADLYGDSVVVINLQSGRQIERWKCGHRPYRLLLSPGDRELLVSSWADGAVYQYDANTGKEVGKTRVAAHPTDMLWVNKPAPPESSEPSTYTARLFVAAANTNNVYSFGVTQDVQLTMLESINVSMTPM
ncbi:MAG: beta-propeller fold lactonase family protein, partial [Acidobacteriaceae bacterium]|nr:beta-propeller fold lactonase family protein [Acidobacteriaceae bacterium]